MIQKYFAKAKITYDGEYRGIVVDVVDPLQLGRVRVRVWGISDASTIPVQAVPWAKPKPSVMNGSIGKFGSFWVPDINSKVTVVYEDGNPLSPMYTSEAPDGVDGLPDLRLTNYPYRNGFKLSNGLELFIDKKTNEVKMTHPSGTTFDFDGSGNMTALVTLMASIVDLTQQRLCQTGDLKASIQTATHSGWLLLDGVSTIGPAGSGATYSGAPYQALYVMMGGNWNSKVKITLPDGRGKNFVGLDNMGGVDAQVLKGSGSTTNPLTAARTTILGIIGEGMHTLLISETESHQHYGYGENPGVVSWPFGTLSGGQPGSSGTDHDNAFFGTTWTGGTNASGGFAKDPTVPHNVVQPGLMVGLFVKI